MGFKTGDIVRLAKDDDSGAPMRVLEVSDFPSGITMCATGDGYKGDSYVHAYATFDTEDLEAYPTTKTLEGLALTRSEAGALLRIEKECNTIEEAIASIRRMMEESQ
jgi:hypothetical protein